MSCTAGARFGRACLIDSEQSPQFVPPHPLRHFTLTRLVKKLNIGHQAAHSPTHHRIHIPQMYRRSRIGRESREKNKASALAYLVGLQ